MFGEVRRWRPKLLWPQPGYLVGSDNTDPRAGDSDDDDKVERRAEFLCKANSTRFLTNLLKLSKLSSASSSTMNASFAILSQSKMTPSRSLRSSFSHWFKRLTASAA